MIACDGVTVHQGAFTLGPIDLTIEDGQYVCLMGPTGCGKTTLIESICGLRRVHAGSIWVDDRDITHADPAVRGVGYVPQDAALFPTIKVYGQIAFGMSVRRVGRLEIDRTVHSLAEELGISHLLDRDIVGLSGGERQRIALARALAIEPGVLLLDEPLAALDEDRREDMVRILREVRVRHHMSVLHITHSRVEAEALGDVIVRLDAGQMITSDATQADAPAPVAEVREHSSADHVTGSASGSRTIQMDAALAKGLREIDD